MATDITTPVGRFVQGSLVLRPKKDARTGKPKLDDKGNGIEEVFIALAIPKYVSINGQMVENPDWPEFYGAIWAEARLNFASLFDPQTGYPTRKIALKVQDGDGVDDDGVSVAGKPGFAGHWVVKLQSMYAPRCYPQGRYTPNDMFTDPDKAIKLGDWLRIGVRIDGNKVDPNDRSVKPGVYVSPNLVEMVGYGEAIITGADPQKVFGGAKPSSYIPAGMSNVPISNAPASGQQPPSNMTPPPQPGQQLPPPPGAQAPANNLPPPPGAQQPQQYAPPANLPPPPGAAPQQPYTPPQQHAPLPPPPGAQAPANNLPPPPGANVYQHQAAAGPVYQMTAQAQGGTREVLLANGWTDETLLAHGLMVRVG